MSGIGSFLSLLTATQTNQQETERWRLTRLVAAGVLRRGVQRSHSGSGERTGLLFGDGERGRQGQRACAGHRRHAASRHARATSRSSSRSFRRWRCRRRQKQFLTPRYGSFYDTTDQTAPLANTAYGLTYNTTDLSQGVTIGSPTSRVYVDRPNVYNIQFSAQFINTAGGAHQAWVWLRKNGTRRNQTARPCSGFEGNNTEDVAAWNFLLQMNAGDYFELMWEVDEHCACRCTQTLLRAFIPLFRRSF